MKLVQSLLVAVLALFVFETSSLGQEKRFSDLVGNVTVGDVQSSSNVRVPYLFWGADVATFYANGNTKTQGGSIYNKLGLNVGLASMRNIVQQVRFFGTAEQGVSVIAGEPLHAEGNTLTIGKPQKDGVVLASNRSNNIQSIMKDVVDRCKRIGILETNVTIGYGSTSEARANELCFDPQYMIATVPETPKMHFPPSPGNSPPLRKKQPK